MLVHPEEEQKAGGVAENETEAEPLEYRIEVPLCCCC